MEVSPKLPYHHNISSCIPLWLQIFLITRLHASWVQSENYQLLQQLAREVNVETIPGLPGSPPGSGEGRELAEAVSVPAPQLGLGKDEEPVPAPQLGSTARKGGNMPVSAKPSGCNLSKA